MLSEIFRQAHDPPFHRLFPHNRLRHRNNLQRNRILPVQNQQIQVLRKRAHIIRFKRHNKIFQNGSNNTDRLGIKSLEHLPLLSEDQ